MIKNYIQLQIQEIRSHKSLMWYGFFLSLIHVVTFYLWYDNAFIYHYVTKNANTICWPHIPFCESLRFFSPLGAEIFLYLYLSLSIFTAFLFINKKTVWLAYSLFFVINIAKLYIFFLDYRLMGNYHYMPFVISFLYLFAKQRLFFIPLMIVLFYAFAGLLKLSNLDWMTGLALPKRLRFFLFFNEEITMLLCFYVVCLETIGSWLLILKTRWKAFAYMQFLLFHAMSYFIVGYFYPLVMFAILSLFIFAYIFNEKCEPFNLKKMYVGYLFVLFFIIGNTISTLIPGDAALTGEGRIYGLNLFDAHSDCDSQIFIKFKDQTIQEPFSSYKEYPARIRCIPYIDFNTSKKICAFYKNEPNFIDLDWSFYSRLRSETHHIRLVNEKNFCSKNLEYYSWRKNPWIKIRK